MRHLLVSVGAAVLRANGVVGVLVSLSALDLVDVGVGLRAGGKACVRQTNSRQCASKGAHGSLKDGGHHVGTTVAHAPRCRAPHCGGAREPHCTPSGAHARGPRCTSRPCGCERGYRCRPAASMGEIDVRKRRESVFACSCLFSTLDAGAQGGGAEGGRDAARRPWRRAIVAGLRGEAGGRAASGSGNRGASSAKSCFPRCCGGVAGSWCQRRPDANAGKAHFQSLIRRR